MLGGVWYGVCMYVGGVYSVCAWCVLCICVCAVCVRAGGRFGGCAPHRAGQGALPAPRLPSPPLPEPAFPRGTRSCRASLLWPQNCRSGAGQTCHLPGWPALQGLSRRPSPPLFNLRGSPVRPWDVSRTKQGSRCPVGAVEPGRRRRPTPGWTPEGATVPDRSRAPSGRRRTGLRVRARKAGHRGALWSTCELGHGPQAWVLRVRWRDPGCALCPEPWEALHDSLSWLVLQSVGLWARFTHPGGSFYFLYF